MVAATKKSNGVSSSSSSSSAIDSLLLTMSSNRLIQLVMVGVAAFMYSFAIDKARIYDARIAVEQMLLRDWTIMKLFMMAVASSCFVFYLFLTSSSKVARQDLQTAIKKHYAGRGIVYSGIGSFIQGISMGCGVCGGPVIVGLGRGLLSSMVVQEIGNVVGSFAYSMVHPSWKKSALYRYRIPSSQSTLYNYFNIPLERFMLISTAVFVLGAIFFEVMFPTTTNTGYSLTSEYWSGMFAGIFIGLPNLLLIPSVLSLIGITSVYPQIYSMLFGRVMEGEDFKQRAANPFEFNRWRIYFVLMAILGGFVSSYLSGTNAYLGGDTSDVLLSPPAWLLFVGSFTAGFGSRMTDGCSSGHGVSGLSTMLFDSVLYVPAYFGSGIITAFCLNYFAPWVFSNHYV